MGILEVEARTERDTLVVVVTDTTTTVVADVQPAHGRGSRVSPKTDAGFRSWRQSQTNWRFNRELGRRPSFGFRSLPSRRPTSRAQTSRRSRGAAESLRGGGWSADARDHAIYQDRSKGDAGLPATPPSSAAFCMFARSLADDEKGVRSWLVRRGSQRGRWSRDLSWTRASRRDHRDDPRRRRPLWGRRARNAR